MDVLDDVDVVVSVVVGVVVVAVVQFDFGSRALDLLLLLNNTLFVVVVEVVEVLDVVVVVDVASI